jgi:hypothetical protein
MHRSTTLVLRPELSLEHADREWTHLSYDTAGTHRSDCEAGSHIRTFCRVSDDVLLGEPLG